MRQGISVEYVRYLTGRSKSYAYMAELCSFSVQLVAAVGYPN